MSFISTKILISLCLPPQITIICIYSSKYSLWWHMCTSIIVKHKSCTLYVNCSVYTCIYGHACCRLPPTISNVDTKYPSIELFCSCLFGVKTTIHSLRFHKNVFFLDLTTCPLYCKITKLNKATLQNQNKMTKKQERQSFSIEIYILLNC